MQGDIHFYISGTVFKPTRGDLFIISSTQLHGPKILSDSIYERSIVHFSPKFAKKFCDDTVDLLDIFETNEEINVIHLSEEDIQTFTGLINKLQHLEAQDDTYYGKELLLQSYLAQILVLVNHNSYNKSIDTLEDTENKLSPMTANIVSYIQENLKEDLSLDKIQEHFNINKHYMNRVFKDELGTSIYQFIIINKIALAKQMLEAGMDASTVSYKLNYSNYSTFARAFKKITGYSPTHYVNTIH